nr:unnamed protein product [Callosobruchus chinensis]
MEGGGAYGGGKAGGAFDPITFVQRPHVILRAVCWLFSVIVFGCISSQGWRYDKVTKRQQCLYNDDTNACNYGVGISVIAFLASMAFLAGEYLFEQMSSVKTRKHFVMVDLGFSAFWAFLYFVGFCYLTNAWGKSVTPPDGVGVSNVRAAIAFCFFAMFSWAGSAFLAYQRFRQGVDAAFATNYEADSNMQASYPSYPGATDTMEQQYQEPPFSGGTNQRGPTGDFQAPAY